MTTTTLRPGFDLSAPGAIDELLAFHRARFGDARMEDDPNKPADADKDKTTGVELDGERFQFPDSTPLAEMTEPQRTEYWRHKARKHEATVKHRADYDDVKAKAVKYDEHQASTASDVDKASAAGRAEGERTAAEKYQRRLVEAEFRATAGGRVSTEALNGYLEDVDLGKFLGADGEPDTSRIEASVARLAPKKDERDGKRWPRGASAGGDRDDVRKTGTAAGRDLYNQRRKPARS